MQNAHYLYKMHGPQPTGQMFLTAQDDVDTGQNEVQLAG